MAQKPFFVNQPVQNTYEKIVYDLVSEISKTKDLQGYTWQVEMLLDIMSIYVDDEFKDELRKRKIKPDLSNPYFDGLTQYQKIDYARKLFRAIVKLIHRSGFDMPIKKVEGILDEETIDAILYKPSKRELED